MRVRCCWFILLLSVPVTAQGQRRAEKEALLALDASVKSESAEEFLGALESALQRDTPRLTKAALDAYAQVVAARDESLQQGSYFTFHRRVARAFRAVRSKKSRRVLTKQQKRHSKWEVRLLLLEVALQHDGWDDTEAALVALQDKHASVIRRSLGHLAEIKDRDIVRKMIDRYLEVAAKARKEKGDSDWTRTSFMFAGALKHLLGVDLREPEDFRNYFNSREDDPDLFKPRKTKRRRGRITLFGANVTGKNIVFVIDRSGSMLATDVIKVKKKRGQTVVGKQKRPKSPPKEHQRMERAKKELTKVVRALPPDTRFNLISYSSHVETWKSKVVAATKKNKEAAVKFVQALEPEGITVTDYALESAFSDDRIDTIYLMSDGAPTHIGSRSADLPRDAPQLMEDILRYAREANFLRGVRIFTFGFKDAEEKFMRRLAKSNGGEYVRIR